MKKTKDYVDFEEIKKEETTKKLSNTELKELQEAMNAVNEIQMQIGGVEAYKAELLTKFSVVLKELESTRSILSGKYGNVNIDINSGDIEQTKENHVDKKD